MVDYHLIRSNNHGLPDPEPEVDQEAQQPIVVDFVYNELEERNGKTIAIKISFRLPVKSYHRTKISTARRKIRWRTSL